MTDPDDDPVVALWAVVSADPVASALLDDLDTVRTVLGSLAGALFNHDHRTDLAYSSSIESTAVPGARSLAACARRTPVLGRADSSLRAAAIQHTERRDAFHPVVLCSGGCCVGAGGGVLVDARGGADSGVPDGRQF